MRDQGYEARIYELEEMEAKLWELRDEKNRPPAGHSRIMAAIQREHRDRIWLIARTPGARIEGRSPSRLERKARIREARDSGRLFVLPGPE